ncbi:hypothetical protein [Rhizorhabdus sp.]|uniref:hypothetical protein n=1 Tax=Rhizorhabdus sp. TaxID=1968843 RepID=UPI0019CC313D|nr:hypothetical protein [Rhizorhabdus sp.]MBD3761222.1 hypothetical protein [Rhizorhabdus sp.]
MAMYFDFAAIRQELGEKFDSLQPLPFAYGHNAALRVTLGKFKALVQEPEIDELLAESLCLASLEIFGIKASSGAAVGSAGLAG